ncbi:hypothetical protein AB1Y20_022417 [Prymnesium parvum]|uniref:Serine hydrolase domain-containing protein n=1 Tax=Prymnesium parvum TaxID=97485 RepID=A0AB34JHH7_PRYPA
MAASPPPRPPRVAFLHGTAGNASILQIQLGPLLSRLRAHACHFIEGRAAVADDSPIGATMRRHFGAGQQLLEYARAAFDERDWRIYPDLDDALAYVERELAALPGGGADVLVGFSQGANLISCVAALLERKGTPLRCVVLLSPHRPGWARQRPELFSSPLSTPAIIAWCPEDTMISGGPEETAKLWAPGCAKLCPHSGPLHRPLPANNEERAALLDDVLQLISQECARL